MTTYGVTPAGFVVKPFTAILAGKQAAVLAALGNSVDLSPSSPMGQLLAILSNDEAQLWELAQTVWNAFNPQAVEGAGLDNLGALRGIPREAASFTQVPCTLTISAANAPYAAGTLVANVSGNAALTFSNLSTVTAGMISGGTATGIVFQAQTAGATPSINPGTLTQITNPVTGWTAITNPTSQTQLGANAELDPNYESRQETELGITGSSNPSALAAALVALGANQNPPIQLAVEILENVTDQAMSVGGLSLPPHSFAPIVYDPTSTLTSSQIGNVVWNNKPAGIQTIGTTAVQIIDPILGAEVVNYTAPTPVTLYVVTTIVVRTGYVFSTVASAVQTALQAAAVAPTPPNGSPPNGQLLPGQPVIGSQLEAVIMGVAGVLDMQALTFGFSTNPTNTAPLPTLATQIATLLATNVTVNAGTAP